MTHQDAALVPPPTAGTAGVDDLARASVATKPANDDLAQRKFVDTLKVLETTGFVGTQVSMYGVKGLPATGLDDLTARNLNVIETALEPRIIPPTLAGLGLIHREGLTFEYAGTREVEMYRAWRQEQADLPRPGCLPDLLGNEAVRRALDNTVIIGGRSSQYAADRISDYLGIQNYSSVHQKFANTESHVNLPESIRGKHVVIVQMMVGDVDVALASTKLLLDAASRAGASALTVAAPFLPYLRADRRGKERTSVSASEVFSELNAAARGRLDRVVSIDVHALQAEGMSGNINLDNLSGAALFLKPLQRYVAGDEVAVVFPDAGARKRASEDGLEEKLAIAFGHPKFGSMAKSRPDLKNAKPESHFEGDPAIIAGRKVIVFEDMVDTGGTAQETLRILWKYQAKEVYFCATHPIFSRGAVESFRNATVEVGGETRPIVSKLFTCDTIPLRRAPGDLIEVASVYPMLSHFLAGVVSNGNFSTRELADKYSGLNGNGHAH